MDRERFFIDKLIESKITQQIGDDAAIIGKNVYAMDLFCEDVHFKKGCFSYYHIGKKAMLVNISDILSMGSKPKYALLGVSFDDKMKAKDIIELQRGIVEVARKYRIKIIGGDTIKDTKLNIAITMIGESPEKALLRNSLKARDVLFYTGSLGEVAKDMRYLYRGGILSKDSKFLTPKLNSEFIYDIARFAKSAMDISDGLFCELNRLSKLNNVRFKFFKKPKKQLAKSGEEYELLFSIASKDIRKLKFYAKKHKIKITKLAKILKGRTKYPHNPHHF